jgi:predicted DsbA family dithiol-disulfide isomerase
MDVEIWSDVVCPWCYVGKRRFEEALARFEHKDAVVVHFRSFELDPHAPRVREGNHEEQLASKYGMSIEAARASHRRLADLASEHGVTMRFDQVRSGNTFDAHRLLHLAAEHGVQGQLKERLMSAYFTEGRAIGDTDTLAALAVETGLAEDLVREVLGGGAYADDVRADEALARDYGVTGVPFFVIAGKYAVAGAQRSDVLLDALEQAWSEID